MNALLFILWLAYFPFSNAEASDRHAFYVSITEIHIKQDTAQMALRFFYDDLEFALNQNAADKVFLDPTRPDEKSFRAIKNYCASRLAIEGSSYVNWIGHEYEDDVCWVYVEMVLPKDKGVLFIKNEILMDAFENQQNIIHFYRGDSYETQLATKSKPEVRFLLEKN